MKIKSNDLFKQLLREYRLPKDLAFSMDLPKEITNIISDTILITDYGIKLKSFGGELYKATESFENQSIIEDNQNHFHVDFYSVPCNNKNVFMLGIKTLQLLAQKFQDENIEDICCWFSFQTPELAELWAKHQNLYEENEEHYISDRLSFYKKRCGEVVISPEIFESKFWAILTIETGKHSKL